MDRAPLRDEDEMDPRFIDDLARRLSAAVPESVSALRQDLEDNFRAVLQSGMARFDLVTRQEFEIQMGVLKRTRAKLEALEARLASLEQQEQPTPPEQPRKRSHKSGKAADTG